jgi:hypothetical protein
VTVYVHRAPGSFARPQAELRTAADLECGRHAELIPELQRLAARRPLRERLWLLLMRALSGAGRHAEAMGAYDRTRTVIAEQLGVAPGPESQQFHARLLTVAVRVPRQDQPDGADGSLPGRAADATAPAEVSGAAAGSVGLSDASVAPENPGEALGPESVSQPGATPVRMAYALVSGGCLG